MLINDSYSSSRFWPAWFLCCCFFLLFFFSEARGTLSSTGWHSPGTLEQRICLDYVSFHRIRNLKTECCSSIIYFFPWLVHPEEPCKWVISCQLRNAQEMVDICILFWLGEMETISLSWSHIRIFFYRQLLRWIMDASKCPWKLSFRRQKLNRKTERQTVVCLLYLQLSR